MRRLSLLVVLLALLGVASRSVAQEPAGALTAVDLRCEHLVNPLGIGERKPRLSWAVRATERGAGQSAYRVMVASSAELLLRGQPDLWDSGRVASAETTGIEYGGVAPASGQRCHWMVRAWDGDGRMGPWSGRGFWEMGLLARADWAGEWMNAGTSRVGVTIRRAEYVAVNVSAGTLTGGTFHLGGDLKADNLAGLTTLAGSVILDGPAAALRDAANLDVAPGISTVASGGELGVLNGRNLTTSSNLTLGATGQLTVGAGSDLTVNGTITNFSSGTFTGGQLDVEGTLRFNGAAIDTIDADIALTNATADIVDENNNSAFAALSTITPSGSFEISGGRSLTLSGALGSAGALTVGTGSTLASPGFVTQFNGSTNLNGTLSTPTLFVADGLLSGAGTLAGNLDCDGDFNPGNSPGLFTVDGNANFRPSSLVIAEIGGLARGLDHDAIDILGSLSFEFGSAGAFQVAALPSYVASAGDEFFIIRYNDRQGQFQNVFLPGLPGGLFFELFYDVPSPIPGDTSRFIQLVVVPAPAGSLALAAGLLALARRRRH